jgi:glycosyltransferase involved in cell wall biosynthesis
LRALGHDVHELWRDDLGPKRIHHGNLHYLLELPWRYRDALREQTSRHTFDVIQLSQPHAWLAAKDHQLRGVPGIFLNRSHGWEAHVHEVMLRWPSEPGVKHKSILHRWASNVLQLLLRRHEVHVVRHSDGLVVGSVDDRDFLLHCYQLPPERVLAVPPGLPPIFLDTPPPSFSAARLRRWLYTGQFAPFKGPSIVAGVINSVFPANPDLEFTWIAQTEAHDQIRRLIAPELWPRVHLAGWMPHDALIKVYDNHGVYLFPSYFEGFAKTFLEAMARGLCVVATSAAGMSETIRSGDNGFLAPVGDMETLTRLALQVSRDEARACAMSASGRKTTEAFTWRQAAQKLVAFCERLLEAKRGRPAA